MTKITQKQLIESLNQLKEIKPRKEWAVLLKSNILAQANTVLVNENKKINVKVEKKQVELSAPERATYRAKSVGIMETLSSVFAPRKLAYAFSVVLLLFIGIFGFANYTVPGDLLFPVKKVAEQSQAALTGHMGLRQDVATLNSRISDLSQVAREGRTNNIPSAIDEIKMNASQLAKNLKDSPTTDQATIKEIASSLKVLADVPGTDLSVNPDVISLYQAVVYSQIADLQGTTLTNEQKDILAEAIDLYSQKKYADALEKILLISK